MGTWSTWWRPSRRSRRLAQKGDVSCTRRTPSIGASPMQPPPWRWRGLFTPRAHSRCLSSAKPEAMLNATAPLCNTQGSEVFQSQGCERRTAAKDSLWTSASSCRSLTTPMSIRMLHRALRSPRAPSTPGAPSVASLEHRALEAGSHESPWAPRQDGGALEKHAVRQRCFDARSEPTCQHHG